MKINKFFKMLGPGLLYAGAAVGVSHLVQSTKAGAFFGFELVIVLLLANVIKYPFFEFGPRYANATGKSLINGYQMIGKWAIHLYTILTLLTMFAIQAAVTIVTAGIVGNIFNLEMNPIEISAIILVLVMIILVIGKYSVLDNLIKYIIVILALSTILAVIFGISKGINPDLTGSKLFSFKIDAHIIFLVAFIGWMPAPIDISVWHSLWSVAKTEQLGYKPKLKQSLLDFNIGYIGTVFIALGFLTLGAIIMFGSGETLSDSGIVFSGQLINMYTKSLGQWSYWLIAIAALTTMFSTTLTVFDAYPRVMQPITDIYLKNEKLSKKPKLIYWFWSLILFIGTIGLMQVSKGQGKSAMQSMINLATHISFVTAPVFAILNYFAVNHKHVPESAKPKLWLKVYSWLSIAFLTAFSVFYIIWKFF